MKSQTTNEIVPVEIRPGIFIRIQGIPHDFSEAEATKVSNVVMAICSGNEEISDD
jgi:hypothetical protein